MTVKLSCKSLFCSYEYIQVTFLEISGAGVKSEQSTVAVDEVMSATVMLKLNEIGVELQV